MRWKGREQSENVEDRRGGGRQLAATGGGGIIVVLVILAIRFFGGGQQAQQLGGQIAGQLAQGGAGGQAVAGEGVNDEAKEFVAVVLRDTEVVWTDLFRTQVEGASYTPPKLVMFDGAVDSGCGRASAAVGPFYCPADRQVYLDPAFFTELSERFGAGGDFAQAYVIAHEVAHHVQNLLQYSKVADQARATGDEVMANQYSVRLELQADFLAGVWAHYADKRFRILESGDTEEAINAANKIGDDALQQQAQGYVVPERFTHGTSKQRAYWFKRGLDSGKLADCEELFTRPYDRL